MVKELVCIESTKLQLGIERRVGNGNSCDIGCGNKGARANGSTEAKHEQLPEQITHGARARDSNLLHNGLQTAALEEAVAEGGRMLSTADTQENAGGSVNDSWAGDQKSPMHVSMNQIGKKPQGDLSKEQEGQGDLLDDLQDVLLDYDTTAGFGQGQRRSRSFGGSTRALKEVTTPMSSSSSQNRSVFGGWGDSEGDGTSLETSSPGSERGGGRVSHVVVQHVQRVTVVGTRQIHGGASIGDRLVGVKGYVAYRLAVEGRVGGAHERSHSWEVERRYRDLVALYHELQEVGGRRGGGGGAWWASPLKTAGKASGCGCVLPTCWAQVAVQSRQLFGNTSAEVVHKRSCLMKECLESLLELGPPLSTCVPFLEFLSPASLREASTGRPSALGVVLSGASSIGAVALEAASASAVGVAAALTSAGDRAVSAASPLRGMSTRGLGRGEGRQYTESSLEEEEMWEESSGGPWSMGRTIHLALDIPPKRSLEELMQAQHAMCAGCGRPLRLSSLPSFAQGLGMVVGSGAGARVCDYEGQLFCLQCHTNDSAITPARVLHDWDFRPRRVSTLAKAYLDSIYDQPMLCVSAVNPYLYTRVPILAHVREARHRLHEMLTFVRCSATSRLEKAAGLHKYLLDRNDFYALRDLADLSRGAFAGLPEYLRLMAERLLQHMLRCSLCRSAATPCGAPFICPNSNDAIFAFQTEGIVRCSLCSTAFHLDCFSLYGGCAACLAIGKLKDMECDPLNGAPRKQDRGSLTRPPGMTTPKHTSVLAKTKDAGEKERGKRSSYHDITPSESSRNSWPWSGAHVSNTVSDREDAMVGMSVLHEGSLDL